jgi:hypothetical protein
MFFLNNTKGCVRSYGGAVGGASLLERSSTTSVDWEEVGGPSRRASSSPQRTTAKTG